MWKYKNYFYISGVKNNYHVQQQQNEIISCFFKITNLDKNNY